MQRGCLFINCSQDKALFIFFYVFKDVLGFSKMSLICMSEHMNKWN